MTTPLQENWENRFDRDWSDAADPTPNRKIRIKKLISILLKETEERVRKEMKNLVLSVGAEETNIAREEGMATSRITSMIMKLLRPY